MSTENVCTRCYDLSFDNTSQVVIDECSNCNAEMCVHLRKKCVFTANNVHYLCSNCGDQCTDQDHINERERFCWRHCDKNTVGEKEYFHCYKCNAHDEEYWY